jgi:hypothetical protein
VNLIPTNFLTHNKMILITHRKLQEHLLQHQAFLQLKAGLRIVELRIT